MNTRSKKLPAKERRIVTVEAVIELAAVLNPADITTAAIAKQMNLTQGALFRHFPTKEALWLEVIAWVSEQLLAKIDCAAQGVESPIEALQAMFFSHIDFVADHPGAPRMLLSELQCAEQTPAKQIAQTMFQGYGARLHRHLERGKARGEISLDLDSKAAATLFIGTIQGLFIQYLIMGDIEQIRNDAPRVFAIYRRGIERRNDRT
ncbi:TetR family transcriptional regulator [Marinosulfonomonas sp. PRT-SC04]|nr:TetR family transcriptional regulator [Marinosulfonomonas sp. PRT-SC04]